MKANNQNRNKTKPSILGLKPQFIRMGAEGNAGSLGGIIPQAEPPIHVPSHLKWLPYGEDNLYPQRLQAFRNMSSTHAALLKLKAQLCAGEGWLEQPHLQGFDQILLQQLSVELALYGGFALQVIWAKSRKHIAQIQLMPFGHLRVITPPVGEAVQWYAYSPHWEAWEKQRSPSAKPMLVRAFSQEAAAQYPRQILYAYEYSPALNHYPEAPYQAALTDIRFEEAFSQFRLQTMRNGMFPAMHIEVEGSPSEEEKEIFYQELKKKFAGANNAAEVLITYGYEGHGRVKITPIEVKANADLFKAWASDARQRIITAHRLSSPVLAGLPGSGSLGGSGNEIAQAFEHFYNTVIRQMQQLICLNLDKLLPFLPTVNEPLPQPKQLAIANAKPVRFPFGENLLARLLTLNELREELGFQPIEQLEEQDWIVAPKRKTNPNSLQ